MHLENLDGAAKKSTVFQIVAHHLFTTFIIKATDKLVWKFKEI